MAEDDFPRLVKDNRRGDGLTQQERGNFPCRNENRQFISPFSHKSVGLFFVSIHVYHQEDYVLPVFQCLIKPVDGGHFRNTGRTPGCPEVNEYHVPFQRCEGYPGAFPVPEGGGGKSAGCCADSIRMVILCFRITELCESKN